MAKDPLKQISLIQELELGIETTKSGLALIQAIKPMRTPVFLIFLTLSTGLERIFKILLGMRLLTEKNRFLTDKELRKYGHDLQLLIDDIVKFCFDTKDLGAQIRKDDYNFLANNLVLKELLLQLTEFAKYDRYVYMSRIADDKSNGKWLSHRWDEIERVIVPISEVVNFINSGREDEYKNIISSEIVKCIERLLGSLGRAITLGAMNKDAKSAGTLLYDFVLIRNGNYGKTNYEMFGYSAS